jgi:hypothetical protein
VSEYRDYENGVADVIAFLLGDRAVVERNVRLPGALSKKDRQIDVLVRGWVLGRENATLIIDCKRWGTKVDVNDVGAFIDMVKDVGADGGLLITTVGATDGAQNRACAESELHIEVMSLGELVAWSPTGTVTVSYRLPADRQNDAERVLRNAGFRAVVSAAESTADQVVLDTIRHYGTRNPPGEVQTEQMEATRRALTTIGIEPVDVSHGVTMGGGTPAHRWLKVAVDGLPTDLKVLAATESEAEMQLDRVAVGAFSAQGIPRSALSVIRPDGWPVTGIFSPASLES